MKMGVLSGLKPEKVFYYFEELCKIPHGSYHTKQISDYLVQFAKERNLECSQDDSNNFAGTLRYGLRKNSRFHTRL